MATMCIACEFPASQGHWTEAGTARGPDAAKERSATLSALGAALAADNLQVNAANLWSGFRISTEAGRFENAQNLEEAWVAAERMLGHAVDPLDPHFIAQARARAAVAS
jgi:hypothetical protein